MNDRIRWRAARILNRSCRWCWADLVTWALRWHPFREVRDESRCADESRDCGLCYCGKYADGVPLGRGELRTPDPVR